MVGSVRGTHLIISIKDQANLLVGLLAGLCQLDGFKQNAKKRPINSDEDLEEASFISRGGLGLGDVVVLY